MSPQDWIVAAIGGAVVGAINWYFFFAPKRAQAALRGAGRQTVEIEVRGGYDPGVVRVKRGVPLQLVFNRQETSSCSEEIVIPAFGVRKFLPAYKKTTVNITPAERGSFEITCGMSMLHGRLEVED